VLGIDGNMRRMEVSGDRHWWGSGDDIQRHMRKYEANKATLDCSYFLVLKNRK